MAEKRIETVEMRAGDVKTGFGNPRKITKKKKDELRNSIETFGDFGSFIIDENDNIIGGNMRLSVIKEMDPDTIILCKEDWFANGEWVECEGCGKIINYGDGCNDTKCPNCGKAVEV